MMYPTISPASTDSCFKYPFATALKIRHTASVTMIEWANLIEEILPQDYQEVQIEKDLEKGFDYRTITIREVHRA